jgi:hypothetical protein
MKEKSRVKNVDLYATRESQPIEIKEKSHLKKKSYSSLRWESAYSKSLIVGAYGNT